MRILDRYVLTSVVTTFLSCLFLFFFLYIIVDIFAHLDEILKQKTAISLILQYYSAYLPVIFTQTSPIACLLATTYTLGRLNSNNEIIAMRTAGLSIWQISSCIFIFGLLVSIVVFYVNDKYVPKAQVQTEKLKAQMFDSNKPKEDQQSIKNMAIYGLKNRLIFISLFDPKKNLMDGITILEHDENQNLISKIVASKGIWKDGEWKFYQYTKFQFDLNSQIKGEPVYSEEQVVDLKESPRDLLRQRQLPQDMDITQLKNYIFRLSKSGANTVLRNLKVDLYQKIAFPFTNLIITFVGVPFSLIIRRRVIGISAIGVSAAICFLYYVTFAVSLALGKAGVLPPILAATLSQIIFLSMTFYLIGKIP